MIETHATFDDGVLIESRQVEVPDPEPTAQVSDIAQALAALPPDTLAALRAALGI